MKIRTESTNDECFLFIDENDFYKCRSKFSSKIRKFVHSVDLSWIENYERMNKKKKKKYENCYISGIHHMWDNFFVVLKVNINEMRERKENEKNE